jgi:hypothetical protein
MISSARQDRRMRGYDQLLADVTATIAWLQDQLAPTEQMHRLLLRAGDDRPLFELQELKRLLEMAIELLEGRSKAGSR